MKLSKTSRTSKFLILLLAITVTLFSCLARTGQARINNQPTQQQINTETSGNGVNAISPAQRDDEVGNNNINSNRFKVPFVVLMSSHEISVAQLPLIGYGNVSVVYRPNVDDEHYEDEEAESLEGQNHQQQQQHKTTKDRKKPSQQQADAREFEQMPTKSPSTSLGTNTFDRQQIAASSGSRVVEQQHDREEVGDRSNGTRRRRRSSSSSSSEDVARGVQESDPLKREEARAIPREVRSSSGATAEASGNSLHANNNSKDASTVQESSSSSSSAPSATNVTSARFSSGNEREEVVRRGRTEEEVDGDGGHNDDQDDDHDDEPTIRNGAVQFSDFDVHMRLGMAFVADTRGRIHRFKLSGYGPARNDYTNSADASSQQRSGGDVISAYGERSGNSSNEENAAYGLLVDSDDANKVGLFGENLVGRHPTASGAEQSSGKFGSSDDDDSPSDSFETNYDRLQGSSSFVINSARPKIIWSRTRHGIVARQQQRNSASALEKRTTQGALSSVDSRQNLSQPKSDHQMEQMGGDTGEEASLTGSQHHTLINVSGVGSSESVESASTGEFATTAAASRQRSKGTRNELAQRTEIAVDWLNNLLFVLDKHRGLLALDYEGNNELCLIDDFNQQPVNLKADPVNGFLFWLQVGKFHNTIYKLDLNVLDRYHNGTPDDASLISHHYAHPIVTNLPTHAKLFIIDHKHSRIYVPLSSSNCHTSDGTNSTHQRSDDAEIFSTPSDESNVITHMNNTFNEAADQERNVSESSGSMQEGQILAYNLDGTDVGPLRSPKESSHTYNFDDILDITLDTDKGLLYWLTNEGKDLFEEYQGGDDAPYHQAQHNLEGKKYKKLMHFDSGSNQPNSKPRFNLRKLFRNLASSTASNRLARSDPLNAMDEQASGLNGSQGFGAHLSGFSRSAVVVVGGLTIAGLIGFFAYFISRPATDSSNQSGHCNSRPSSQGSYMGESHVGSVANTSGVLGASTISRWITRPSTSSADTSTFNRGSGRNEPLDSCDFESSINYGRGNAVDEHYRDSVYDQTTIIEIEQSSLSNLAKWPSHMGEVSNRLYVPIELQEDETLASIPRVTIDQLHIEKRAPLGEGHFGTVLQGTITCSMHERDILLNKPAGRSDTCHNMHLYANDQESRDLAQGNLNIPSSGSSGHGSSSVSSDFITANSVAEAIHGDYLLPKGTNTNSAASDYSCGAPTVESYISNPNYHGNLDFMKETKFKVAIKKLKENASPKERSDFLQEAKHLAKFDHPNIVSLIGICLDKGSTLIIMELMLGGDLIRYMQENKPTLDNPDRLTPDDLLSICLDIVNACCYLEEHDHIHRDLAARNCLVSSRKKEDRVVKLADFGLARDIYKDSYYKKLNDSAMPLKWMAPECFMEQKFTIKSDVWSFGVVMWEVMSYCQDKPYNNVEHFMMKDHLVQGLRLAQPEHCCEDMYRLMNECWQLDPCRRPTFEECRATLIEIKGSAAAE